MKQNKDMCSLAVCSLGRQSDVTLTNWILSLYAAYAIHQSAFKTVD